MPEKAKNIMSESDNSVQDILPQDFSGVFEFTNDSDEAFTGTWNSVAYVFPPNATSPMIIRGETPEGVQTIRKKFAREWAVREFEKTPKFAHMNSPEQGLKPALYTESDLEPFVQRCLSPLPAGRVTAKVISDPEGNEQKFHKDPKGNPRTKVLEGSESLVGDGTVIG